MTDATLINITTLRKDHLMVSCLRFNVPGADHPYKAAIVTRPNAPLQHGGDEVVRVAHKHSKRFRVKEVNRQGMVIFPIQNFEDLSQFEVSVVKRERTILWDKQATNRPARKRIKCL
jgi:hypothetical protein